MYLKFCKFTIEIELLWAYMTHSGKITVWAHLL